LDDTGSIHCWGGEEGAMYDVGQHSAPSDISFVYVDAGSFHTCGLEASGQVRCWGVQNGESVDFGQV